MKRGGVGCELCGTEAKIHCESDGASLCWGCDHKVHGANFLVGKHIRTLLCHRCHCLSPWTCSGPKVPPCLSFCLSCLPLLSSSSSPLPHQSHQQPQLHLQSPHHDDDDDDDEEVEDDDYGIYTDDDDDDEDDDDDDENQVVPWTPASSSSSSPMASAKTPTTSDEDDDEDEDEDDGVNAKTSMYSSCLSKRQRQSAFLHPNTLPRL